MDAQAPPLLTDTPHTDAVLQVSFTVVNTNFSLHCARRFAILTALSSSASRSFGHSRVVFQAAVQMQHCDKACTHTETRRWYLDVTF